jgi:hypothetical protein
MADLTLACPRCGKAFAIRNRQAGQRYLCPHCRQPFSLQPSQETAAAQPAKPASASPTKFSPEDLLSAPAIIRPKRAKRTPLRLFGPAGFVAALACVGILFVWDRYERRLDRTNATDVTAARSHDPREGSRASTAPSQRKPIELLLAPAGARIVIHLRPSRLWTTMNSDAAERGNKQAATWRASELRLCIPALAEWGRDQIENWCLYPPTQIEEAAFSFTLRSPGEPPHVAVLVRLERPAGRSEVENRFGGTPSSKGSLPIFLKGDRALVVRDEKTFAVGPAEFAQEMAEARDQPNPTDASIEELLKQTDRSRDLTVVFRPDDLDRFRTTLLSPQWSDDLHQLASWLDPEAVEGAVFSVRLDDPLRVRLTARTRPVVRGPRLAETLKERLDRLPTDLFKYVERLQPSGPGSRKIIGRLPAMYKAVALGSAVSSDPRLVTLESVLPERAAPNLTLATYLLLAEGPTELSRAPAAPVAPKREGPKTLAGRLQTVIDVDFKRTPLSDAFDSIGGDIGVTFELDGGAFKLAGYTKNMPQTFQIKAAPASQSLQRILKAYPKLALVGDEARRTITVTTAEAAAAQKKTPMTLGN